MNKLKRQLLVERQEWFSIQADEAEFVSMDDGTIINGEQWLELGDERQNYLIRVDDAYDKSLDGHTEHFDVREYDFENE